MTEPRGRTAPPWFVRQHPRPEAAVRLFCLPYAGSGASAYRRWQNAFDDHVEVAAVQLPGRENRLLEDPVIDPEAIAAAVIDAVADGAAESVDESDPFAFYGHSLGARLAFEVTRSLRRAGAPLPLVVFAAAVRAPHLSTPGPFDGLSEVDDDALIDRLAAGGGLPAAVLAERELLELLLPALRSDFRWLDSYRYLPDDPLDVPIVGLAGRRDHAVTVDQVDAWAEHTRAGFTRHVLDGGHFFLHENFAETTRLVSAELRRYAAVTR